MNITIVGTGYVGLVTGTCMSELGFKVTCIDKDKAKINSLNNGKSPIYEPGLQELILKGIKKDLLSFTHLPSEAFQSNSPDIIFIAVGTPNNKEGVNLESIYEVAEEIALYLDNYKLIVIKSTVPIGTSKKVEEIIYRLNPTAQFDIAMNPEFLREGSAVNDFMNPSRIILGTTTTRATGLLYKLYNSFSRKHIPIMEVNLETAEMIKYASNAFLATKIAFINEIANLCEECHAEIDKVAEGMGLDNRIGKHFLQVGPGFGGSCFPKDTLALLKLATSYKIPLKIIESVITSNEMHKKQMSEKIINALSGNIKGKVVGALGVTFKAQTDDIRDSPALTILKYLQKKGAIIQIYDPLGMDKAKSILPKVLWCESPYKALEGAHVAVILTEWEEFQNLDFQHIKSKMASPILIDLRNLYSLESIKDLGINYLSLGRKPFYHSSNFS